MDRSGQIAWYALARPKIHVLQADIPAADSPEKGSRACKVVTGMVPAIPRWIISGKAPIDRANQYKAAVDGNSACGGEMRLTFFLGPYIKLLLVVKFGQFSKDGQCSVVNELHPRTLFTRPTPSSQQGKFRSIRKRSRLRTTPRELMDPNAGEVGAGVIHVNE
ncbi:hypothetical protein ACOJBO_08030 [Rhizobium beringeri]